MATAAVSFTEEAVPCVCVRMIAGMTENLSLIAKTEIASVPPV